MDKYKLLNREFSRIWRRSKVYQKNEIKWLARKQGLKTRKRGKHLLIVDKSGAVTADFGQIEEESARLRLGSLLVKLKS